MEVKKYELFMRETNCLDLYNPTVKDCDDVYRFATRNLLMDNMDREHVIALAVDSKLNVIGYNIASVGTLDRSYVSQREIFKFLILSNAAGVILLHNHPSGDPTPSTEDIDITKTMHNACELIGIRMLDHIVIGRNTYTSLKSYIQ